MKMRASPSSHRCSVADAGGLDELVVLVAGIGGGQGVGGALGGEFAPPKVIRS